MDPIALDVAVRAIAYPVAGAILANQLEELFFDVAYVWRGLYKKERRRISAEDLRAASPKRIAILVPAWHEAEVIEQMLEHNLAALDYPRDRWEVFCGVYPNDRETIERVDAVAARHPTVHRVLVPHDGPTSKADCLNWVWRRVIAEERRRGERFDVVLLHDAEDVIHPLALRLYSKLVPEKGAVQIPVFSLDRRTHDLVAGTYMDEFAEFHLKELLVRDDLGGLVPSAGVGTAFDRESFERIAGTGDEPFDPTNLTEDYDIALRLRLAGKGLHFACHTVDVPGRDGEVREEYIATREYFPDGVRASVRQRARWICGIALQAWERFGWQGPRAVRYSLWRDRKGLANGFLVACAYLLVVYLATRCLVAEWIGTPWCLADVIPPGSLLELLLQVNLAGLAWRGLAKFHFVRTLYGWRHGVLSLPRLVVANLVVIASTARAVRLYARHRLLNEPLRWAKTDHAFPTADAVGVVARTGGAVVVAATEADAAEGLALAAELEREASVAMLLRGAAEAGGVQPHASAEKAQPTVTAVQATRARGAPHAP